MTRNEFIKLLKDNLKPNVEMDFLMIKVSPRTRGFSHELGDTM